MAAGCAPLSCNAAAGNRLFAHMHPLFTFSINSSQEAAPTASLMDAMSVAEFLCAYGPGLGAPVLDARSLAEAAAWPADGEGELVAIYTALLRFLLEQWVSVKGPAFASTVACH